MKAAPRWSAPAPIPGSDPIAATTTPPTLCSALSLRSTGAVCVRSQLPASPQPNRSHTAVSGSHCRLLERHSSAATSPEPDSIRRACTAIAVHGIGPAWPAPPVRAPIAAAQCARLLPVQRASRAVSATSPPQPAICTWITSQHKPMPPSGGFATDRPTMHSRPWPWPAIATTALRPANTVAPTAAAVTRPAIQRTA